MQKPKVFLTGGDSLGWALDQDLILTQSIISDFVCAVPFKECDIVHSVWWEPLLAIPKDLLCEKYVICHMSGEPFRYLKHHNFYKVLNVVDEWIVRSRQAQQQLNTMGLRSTLIPYTVDINIFRPLKKEDPEIIKMRNKWNIPLGAYLIGNFHRDTQGRDLESPKLMKGPDIFAEIIKGLIHRDKKVHVLLAGPRRFWIRKRLKELSIPFTFIGQEIKDKDDMSVNTLERETLNLLYNILNLCLISSRSEAGPHSILEAGASKCAVVSSKVGIASDTLDERCIYSSLPQAINIIAKDIDESYLQDTKEIHYKGILENHLSPHVKEIFNDLYSRAKLKPASNKKEEVRSYPKAKTLSKRSILNIFSRRKRCVIGLWHSFKKPPWGGGNQFMLAIRKEFRNRKIRVIDNRIHKKIQAYILNAVFFETDAFRNYSKRGKLKIIHRIGSVIHLARGKDRDKDDLCFKLNKDFASATAINSIWCYRKIREAGYGPLNPVIIYSAVDPDIFNRKGKIPFSRKRKIKLISTSWSSNPRKGGAIYKWIEEHLDFNRFEYTFVGNAQEKFNSIKHIPPVPSEELADILKKHDIYISATKNDSCPNAVIEALACGLPVLYLDDGGQPELVGYAGLPFKSNDEILPQLEKIIENYEIFQNLIVFPSLEEVTDKYLALIKEVINE